MRVHVLVLFFKMTKNMGKKVSTPPFLVPIVIYLPRTPIKKKSDLK